MLRDHPELPALVAVFVVWVAALVVVLVLLVGGRRDHHRRRRRHRDDMAAAGLNTHMDDTGVLNARDWIKPNAAGRFVRRTGVRKSQVSGRVESTSSNHPR